MAGILIIAHTPLASALQDCATHVFGKPLPRVKSIDVNPDASLESVFHLAKSAIHSVKESNGTVVLCDLAGATPANIAIQLAKLPQVKVIAGINLPLLIRAICYRTSSLDCLVDKAISGGISGIQLIENAAPTFIDQTEYHAEKNCNHH